MLGLTVDPRPSSRLGCQIRLTDALDGIVVSLPEGQH
jgi:2Fe-2S ferredoxin